LGIVHREGRKRSKSPRPTIPFDIADSSQPPTVTNTPRLTAESPDLGEGNDDGAQAISREGAVLLRMIAERAEDFEKEKKKAIDLYNLEADKLGKDKLSFGEEKKELVKEREELEKAKLRHNEFVREANSSWYKIQREIRNLEAKVKEHDESVEQHRLDAEVLSQDQSI
jgi:hypothetical protein